MATLRINAHNYYYEDYGPKKAPCLLLSPLFYTDRAVYEPLIRNLADDYRIVSYDHRGLGQSDRPANLNIEQSAQDVASLIEQLHLGPCHFVGGFLGAYVGLQLAIHRSDLLKSCILMGATGEPDTDENLKRATGLAIRDLPDLHTGTTFKATRDPIQVVRREIWRHHVTRLRPEELEPVLAIVRRKEQASELHKIHCAVLVLAGDEEAPASLEAYRRLVSSITGAEYGTISHAGAAVIIEQPEDVAEAIRSFLEKAERRWKQKQRQAPRDFGTQASFDKTIPPRSSLLPE